MDPEQDYFVSGMHDFVARRLAGQKGPQVFQYPIAHRDSGSTRCTPQMWQNHDVLEVEKALL